MNSKSEALASPEPETSERPPALILQSLQKNYGGVKAVNDISLSVGGAERVGVIGPNGAGKTTLFKIIAGDIKPTAGTVFMYGDDVTRMSSSSRARIGIGRTFQISNLFNEMTVLDNVRVAARGGRPTARVFWRPQRQDDEVSLLAKESLQSAGLSDRLEDTVEDLSHGEQRQLEIAMALASRPKLLLLDEPAAGLSTAERSSLKALISDLPRDIPMLIIEHDMTLALGLTDRVMCMENGNHVVTGTPDEIRANETVKEIYLGRSGDR